jgi:hypothetical protein
MQALQLLGFDPEKPAGNALGFADRPLTSGVYGRRRGALLLDNCASKTPENAAARHGSMSFATPA